MTAQFNGHCDELARDFSDLNIKRNLLARLKSINLFSHELAVMSRVKADMKIMNAAICVSFRSKFLTIEIFLIMYIIVFSWIMPNP